MFVIGRIFCDYISEKKKENKREALREGFYSLRRWLFWTVVGVAALAFPWACYKFSFLRKMVVVGIVAIIAIFVCVITLIWFNMRHNEKAETAEQRCRRLEEERREDDDQYAELQRQARNAEEQKKRRASLAKEFGL